MRRMVRRSRATAALGTCFVFAGCATRFTILRPVPSPYTST